MIVLITGKYQDTLWENIYTTMSNNRPERGEVTGFDGVKGIKTGKRLQNWMKNQPTGRWHAWSQMKIRYTIVTRKWKWNEREFLGRCICHIGMLKYVKSVLKAEKCTHSLPKIVKEELSSGSNVVMAAKDVVVTCDDNGDQGFDTFMVLCCKNCVSKKNCQLLLKNTKVIYQQMPKWRISWPIGMNW